MTKLQNFWVRMVRPTGIVLMCGGLAGAIGTGIVAGSVGAHYSNVPSGNTIVWVTIHSFIWAGPVMFVGGVLWWASRDPRWEEN